MAALHRQRVPMNLIASSGDTAHYPMPKVAACHPLFGGDLALSILHLINHGLCFMRGIFDHITILVLLGTTS